MEQQTTSRAGKRRVLIGSLVAGALVVLAGGTFAFAHGERGMHGGGMGFGQITDHFQVHVEHVLKEVDATPEQRSQVKAIVDAAARDIEALRAQHGSVHRELHGILSAPAIDRARLEALRASHVEALDVASKRCATALADAADVLTPEQRAQFGEKMAKRKH
ncbi:MAG: Spy/CpxP family protein refolding chaperone [Steroidobacteraceae bacterium]|nr:Spy/CpxP family protein refolding chaperone [Steroidobacteraceae bacterium]